MSGKVSARRIQKYRSEYREQFPCISASSKGEEYAYCIYCRQDLKISGGGSNDIKRHIAKQKHQDNEQAEVNASKISQKVTSFFSKKGDTSVISVEVHFTDFLVEHNIALNASDHVPGLKNC